MFLSGLTKLPTFPILTGLVDPTNLGDIGFSLF